MSTEKNTLITSNAAVGGLCITLLRCMALWLHLIDELYMPVLGSRFLHIIRHVSKRSTDVFSGLL